MPADGLSFARLNLNTRERFQTLRRELDVTTFGVNLMVLQPGQRGRIHSHLRQEEVFLVLEGRLTLIVNGEDHTLETWDLARVAPDLRRQLVNRGPGPVAVLALGSANDHDGRDGVAYLEWEATEGAPPQEVPIPDDLPPSERDAPPSVANGERDQPGDAGSDDTGR